MIQTQTHLLRVLGFMKKRFVFWEFFCSFFRKKIFHNMTWWFNRLFAQQNRRLHGSCVLEYTFLAKLNCKRHIKMHHRGKSLLWLLFFLRVLVFFIANTFVMAMYFIAFWWRFQEKTFAFHLSCGFYAIQHFIRNIKCTECLDSLFA